MLPTLLQNELFSREDLLCISNKNELIDSYRDMLLVRRFEEKSGQLYGMGKISGFCHLYIGQEAVVVGLIKASIKGDQFITGYRSHGHALLSGMEPKKVMSELTGKKTGCSSGKGGSMHMFNIEGGFYGGHGIVGAQVSIGTGLAFANKYKKNNSVSIVFFGDGAANQGQVYESFNMAALWKLPVLYIIENNLYGMGTSIDRISAQKNLSKRGESFGIEGEQVNGMNFLSVKRAALKALDFCRSGNGPYILEMLTYRYRGHSMSDPAKYRTREEIDKIRENSDPIETLKKYLLEYSICSEVDFKEYEEKAKEIVEEAADFALTSSEPDSLELWSNVLN